jgi:DNA-binding MarR family transcriptional regulator
MDSAPSKELLQRTIEKFWETIPPTWNRIRGNVRAIASEQFGISVEQFHILRHIRKGCRSASELAEIQQISRPAISQALDVLVDKGLISRTESPKDRRFVQLELTASGNELLNAIFEKNRAWMAEKMAGLTPEEQQGVVAALELLKKTFDESNS